MHAIGHTLTPISLGKYNINNVPKKRKIGISVESSKNTASLKRFLKTFSCSIMLPSWLNLESRPEFYWDNVMLIIWTITNES